MLSISKPNRQFTPQASRMAQESWPMLVRGIHVLNAPRWIVAIVYALFPFIPKHDRDSLRFHRSIGEMHHFISPSVLPDIFGGAGGPWDGLWMREAIEDTHEDAVEKSYYGFVDI